MKHSLKDLNEYLFDQLDRLSNDDLTDEQMDKEIMRSDAIGKIAGVAIQSAMTELKAAEFMAEYGDGMRLPMISMASTLLGEDGKNG